jgi:hypothetical protein
VSKVLPEGFLQLYFDIFMAAFSVIVDEAVLLGIFIAKIEQKLCKKLFTTGDGGGRQT